MTSPPHHRTTNRRRPVLPAAVFVVVVSSRWVWGVVASDEYHEFYAVYSPYLLFVASYVDIYLLIGLEDHDYLFREYMHQ